MRQYTRTSTIVVIIVLVLGALAAATFSQEDENWLPSPTGPFQIGRTTRHWVDESREERLTDDEDDHRELMVRIWYPADVEEDAIPAPYIEDFSGPMAEEALAAWIPDASPAFQEIIRVTTHAFQDVPVASENSTYPVLIFSPGHTFMPELNTTQIEELASHGYVVVGINHPFISGITVFPDGRMVTAGNPDAALAAQDVLFVLDQLEVLNADDPESLLTGRLDLERIGAIGYSIGGAAVVRAGRQDDRLKAIINEDNDIRLAQLEQPYLYLAAAHRTYRSNGPSHHVWSLGFTHVHFSDIPMWPQPDDRPPPSNSIEGPRTVEIVRAYVLAFFDKYLKGEDVTLFDGPSDDFPEMSIESFNIE